MAKKKMSIHYTPARLVQGESWYIVFYQTDPSNNKLTRHRKSFNLNRIKNRFDRLSKAKEVITWINNMLPAGYPYGIQEFRNKTDVECSEALNVALKIKIDNTTRNNTVRSYKTCVKIFKEWLVMAELNNLHILKIDQLHIISFLDYVRGERKCSARTRNNYLIYLKALFSELLQRKYVSNNPTIGIKHLSIETKSRVGFNQDQKKAIIDFLKKEDKGLLFAVLLMYYCFIRPAELRRLKIHMIDLNDNLDRKSVV